MIKVWDWLGVGGSFHIYARTVTLSFPIPWLLLALLSGWWGSGQTPLLGRPEGPWGEKLCRWGAGASQPRPLGEGLCT